MKGYQAVFPIEHHFSYPYLLFLLSDSQIQKLVQKKFKILLVMFLQNK